MSCFLLNRALLHAAATNDLPSVQRLVAAGADVNTRDEEHRTPLMRAAERGHAAVVQFLLGKGRRRANRNGRG
jgi:hypothetical protein